MLTRLHDEQDGVTLIELLTVIVILGVIGSITLRATVTGLEASRRAQARVEALNDLTRGLERIGREIRVADPLDVSQLPAFTGDDPDDDPANYEVGAIVYRNNRQYQYRYYLTTTDDGDPALQEDVKVYDPDGSGGWTLDSDASTNGLFIVNTVNSLVGTPLLTYYNADGVALSCGDADRASYATCGEYLAGNAEKVKLTLVRSLPEQNDVTVETVITVRSVRIA